MFNEQRPYQLAPEQIVLNAVKNSGTAQVEKSKLIEFCVNQGCPDENTASWLLYAMTLAGMLTAVDDPVSGTMYKPNQQNTR